MQGLFDRQHRKNIRNSKYQHTVLELIYTLLEEVKYISVQISGHVKVYCKVAKLLSTIKIVK